MFSRFRNFGRRCHANGLERRRPARNVAKRRQTFASPGGPGYFGLRPVAGWTPAFQSVGATPAFRVLLMVTFCVVTLVACSSSAPTASLTKHYIEPPKQKKIPASTTALRVCADPNNLPFSNEHREGFENKIADLIAADMKLPVEYTWWAQRRGFFRNTLRAGLCDVVIGVPSSFELAATTRPYYRSTYVFVTRRSGGPEITSLDDPRLRELRIGVQMIGDDGANSPPVHALNNRGLVDNLHGYTLYGDYSQQSPPARAVDAVANGEVDVSIVWGPLAGYFAGKHLRLKPVTPELDPPYLPFVYDISVGVRRGEDELLGTIDEILTRRKADVDRILDEYRVPRVGAVIAAEPLSSRAAARSAHQMEDAS